MRPGGGGRVARWKAKPEGQHRVTKRGHEEIERDTGCHFHGQGRAGVADLLFKGPRNGVGNGEPCEAPTQRPAGAHTPQAHGTWWLSTYAFSVETELQAQVSEHLIVAYCYQGDGMEEGI